MAYYLKFPANSGTAAGNNKLCQLSGIATTGAITVSLEFAENVVDPSSNGVPFYIFDSRRRLDSDSGDGYAGASYFLSSAGTIESAGVSNYKLNGAASSSTGWKTAIAGDVYSFDATNQPDGVVAIGARFNRVEHFPLLALRKIIITDNRGAHTIDMSASGGTANEFTSTDGLITLKLFGFTGASHWVFYSSGSYSLSADGGTFAYSGAAASTLLNRRLSANGGNFNYSGASSALRLNRLLIANGSTFSYAGASAGLLLNRRLNADGASFTYSGAAATLTYTQITGFVLNADGGAFSTAGGEVEFIYVQNFPEANANDFTVSAIVDSSSSFESRISPTVGFSAIIGSTYKFNGRLN